MNKTIFLIIVACVFVAVGYGKSQNYLPRTPYQTPHQSQCQGFEVLTNENSTLIYSLSSTDTSLTNAGEIDDEEFTLMMQMIEKNMRNLEQRMDNLQTEMDIIYQEINELTN